jgi:hypothetical protein
MIDDICYLKTGGGTVGRIKGRLGKAAMAALLLATTAVVIVPSATAAKKIDTKVVVMGVVAGHDDNIIINGRLATENRRCRKQRQLSTFVTLGDGSSPNDGTGVFDGDESSYRGAWAMIVDTHTDFDGDPHEIGATKIWVQAYRRTLGNGTVCKKATAVVPF